MSLKKYLGLTAVGMASFVVTTVMAGGPDVVAPPPPSDSGFYLDAGVGYGRTNWTNFWGGAINPAGVPFTNGGIISGGRGGFAWGGDVGYQFNHTFSFEVGAYKLRTVRGLAGLQAPPVVSPGAVRIASWLFYAAGKVSVPVMENLSIFAKAGVAWRMLNYSGAGVNSAAAIAAGNNLFITNQHYMSVLLGVGGQYWFTPNWNMSVQYLHISGQNQNPFWISMKAPNVDMFMVAAGYLFTT